MLTVVYCTREHNQAHIDHLKKTSGLGKHITVIEIINNGESLTKAYNRGLAQATDNVVVFCHDDITIESSSWGNKLLKHFKDSEYGILGVAGTKYMATSGKWWEDKRKMYGRVEHTHQGKKWLSAYSDDQGNEVEPVIVVDGVFFAVAKDRLKKQFDETVEGFHYYDISFCFDNYLQNVKVGVITNVRVNHKSIGMTNDQWEANRVAFAEKHKDVLPIKIDRILRKHQKLKVLIGCLSFKNFTGSELYVLELAKELVSQGCDVTVCSDIGGPVTKLANQFGIKTASLNEPPSFKLGDGKWQAMGPDGPIPSQPNTLYKVSEAKFDLMHLNHTPVTEHLLRLFPDTETICSIHSEVISLENPVKHPMIKKYIAIRPEIKEHIVNKFDINPEMVDVVYNPIDYKRFQPSKSTIKRDKKRILFVGTIDYLRKEAIQDLINVTEAEGNELWIVGKKHDTYLDAMLEGKTHVTYFEPTFNIEKFVKDCDETAGILLGRTTIEGWLCGKGGWIYNIDEHGYVSSKAFHPVPADVDKFRSDVVAKQIIEKYKEIIK